MLSSSNIKCVLRWVHKFHFKSNWAGNARSLGSTMYGQMNGAYYNRHTRCCITLRIDALRCTAIYTAQHILQFVCTYALQTCWSCSTTPFSAMLHSVCLCVYVTTCWTCNFFENFEQNGTLAREKCKSSLTILNMFWRKKSIHVFAQVSPTLYTERRGAWNKHMNALHAKSHNTSSSSTSSSSSWKRLFNDLIT